VTTTIAYDNEGNQNDKHWAVDTHHPSRTISSIGRHRQQKQDWAKAQRWKPLVRFECPDLLATLRNSM